MSNDYYDYCVFDDTPVCKELKRDNWGIMLQPGGGYHLGIYEDPDKWSDKLYTIAADEFNKKASEYGIDISFKYNKKDRRCLCAEYSGKSIDLGGDWIISWNDLYNLFQIKNLKKLFPENIKLSTEKKAKIQTDIIKRVHTVRWHTFWPCRRYNKENTVNVQRGFSSISIHETLRRLGDCYTKNFEDVCWEGETPLRLERAFCRNKEWFRLFGNIEKYMAFWNLDFDFIDKDVENMIKKQIKDIISSNS